MQHESKMKLGMNLMKTLLPALAMSVIGSEACTAGTDKTLVSWVCLADTAQQGGSALTIQSGDRFDGIVFGERVAGKWMAGSEGFARTQGSQQANAVENADDKTLVQMAIVYQGNQISIYRNGEPYASYEASTEDLLKTQNQAVFGLRHEGAGTGQTLKGSIEDARIYDRALTADEIKKLEPKKESVIKPYAWWTFEKGKETDRMGRFPVNTLSGGAKIEGGRLVLESDGATLIAAGKAVTYSLSPDGLVTPAMPENPPANWLTYHLVHPGPGKAEPGDPNCAFYWKGRYHLHYIYNQDGGPAFAHVSSTDMVHWKWHPTTLFPKFTGHGMFSGTGFITKDGKPAIIYHGWWSGRNQMAFALDDNLEKWTKPLAVMPEPINGKIPEMRHWDPDCWLNGDTYYAISGGGNPPLMKSKDLQKWDYIGDLLHKDMPTTIDAKKDEDISCGNMFKIGNKWMLLCINHGRGCGYYLGDFKDEKYLPDFHAMMSWNGNNYFAPETVLTKDGRRVMWAWIMNLPISPTGVQSLPRELELPKDGVLRIRPLRELEDLRYGKKQEKGITVKSDAAYALKEVDGDALELELTVKAPVAKEFGLDVLCDKDGKNGLRIAVAGESKLLKVGKVEAPFELKKGEDLVLRVFIDKNFVEVFANDRQAAVAAADKYVQEKTSVSLFSKGGDPVVTRVRSWKMKSIYPEGKE
jgi:sucrose-6-phosphate hydrolase SacC (GH32 family)